VINVSQQVSAVRRQIGSRTLQAGEARILTISQTYDAPVEDVWDACTSPDRIPRWFLPITGELRPGGRYQLEGNASGTIERCNPPDSFAATWEFGGGVSWIEVRLTAEPEGSTRVELDHIAHIDDELWDQFGPGAVGVGWDGGFLGLALHLGSGQAVDPAAAAKWMTSPEGREFVELSSQRWCDASIAVGTAEAAARAAADRVTAFYTGAGGPSGS
jgi:uncharacterized protein YndB with AHSA1/START domain